MLGTFVATIITNNHIYRSYKYAKLAHVTSS